MDIDISKLSRDEKTKYAKILSDPCLWAETFLCNPYEDGNPSLKINYVERKILSSKNRFTIVRVHRRAGKSFSFGILGLWYALTRSNFQVLIICPDQSKVDVLFKVISDLIACSPALDGSVVVQRANPQTIEFTNGSTIKGFTTGVSSRRAGQVIRGHTADLVLVDEAAYLGEADWEAVTAIMWGDITRTPISFIASTPTAEHGKYFHWCTDDQSQIDPKLRWNRIHIDVENNPDWTPEKIGAIQATETESTYKQEWLCLFPDIGEGVFKNSYIERAQRDYELYSKEDIDEKSTFIPKGIRAMGVDWDKYQSGPTLVILELDRSDKTYKVIYTEEVPTHAFVLSETVDRIIYLDSVFDCSHI